ncbi:MAG: alpha/beta fold hydrolase [Methylophaga sp.]|nr:alpha/beta fold hydrolase [Methylophaga sp.]
MSLHYQIVGEGGTPLLLIHGLFGSADNWRGIARQLSKTRQVISVDLRNHGRSFQHPQQNYRLMAADIVDVLAELGVDKVNLLGHSIGGKVAMQFAIDYPQLLNKLIVVDIAPRSYPDTHSQIFKNLMAVNLAHFRQRNEVDKAMAAMIPDQAVRSFLLMNLTVHDDQLTWRINLEHLSCNYPSLLQAVTPTATIVQPTLFICGGDSDYIGTEDRQQIRQWFRNVQLLRIANAGHWVHADKPEAFCQTVESFLNHD